MRNILLILIIITLFSCNSKSTIEGRYKHKLCKTSLPCDYFDFFIDGTFIYNKILYSTQHKSFIGSWTIKNDTIKLEPNSYITPDSTKVELLDNKGSSETNISINMLGGYQTGEKPDNLKVTWYVSIDGGQKYTSTDTAGNLYIKKQYINEVRIKDIMQHAGGNKLFRNKDSTFTINSEVDEINIYLALTERYPDELKYMPKKLYLKSNKLYPVDYIKDVDYLNRENNYYKWTKEKTNK